MGHVSESVGRVSGFTLHLLGLMALGLLSPPVQAAVHEIPSSCNEFVKPAEIARDGAKECAESIKTGKFPKPFSAPQWKTECEKRGRAKEESYHRLFECKRKHEKK